MIARARFVDGLVLGLFFASGATALVYEVVWSKYLALMFGSTIQAQTVVLAVYMGGLALGNRLFGLRADLLSRPLWGYGIVEIAIGVYAYSFPWLHPMADQVFVGVGSRWYGNGTALLTLKCALSVALLLGPTVLMGGTLPLLASWLQRSADEATKRSARFYSVNSLGAVTGAGLAGFYLVQNLGLVATLQSAALVNGIIGLLALLVSRRQERNSGPGLNGSTLKADPLSGANTYSPSQSPVGVRPEAAAGFSLRWACVVVAAAGGISMGLEVLAARSLSLIFGSSLQSFAMVLVAFILGIGLGSGAIASTQSRRWRSERAVIGLLLVASFWIGLLVFKIEWWVEFYRWAKSGLARSSVGYIYYQALSAVLSMVVLGVPAALIGSVLPVLIRTNGSESGETGLGQRVGRLLTWNTLGAVAGTLFTGFGLMPWVGLRGSFGVLAGALGVVALGLAGQRAQWRMGAMAAGTLSVVVLLFAAGDDGWRHVMSSGAFRAKETEVSFNVMEQRKKHIRILFYEDAPDATVSIEQGDGIGAPDDIGLRINGKTDASSKSDLSTQLLLGHLPLLARPAAQDVFILGLGSGVTGGAVLAHPIRRMTVAENCEPVIRAARFFESWNGGVLTDPRARIVLEDARTVLKLDPQMYDVIITQPSNPWMAGVGSVFSREYYELAATRLKPGGVMVQWFHLYDMHDGIVEMVMRTFGSVFPHLEIWDSGVGDIVLVGGKRSWPGLPSDYATGFGRDQVRQDLARVGIHSVAGLFARQLASQPTAFAIAHEGRMQSDLHPVLEYEAPRSFYLGAASTMLARFDERTWQQELADPAKAAAVESLPADEVRSVFGAYSSVNEDLSKLLVWRYAGRPGGGPYPGDRVARMPSLLGGAGRVIEPHLPGRPTAEETTLLTAVATLRNRTGAHAEALRTMESILDARVSDPDWSHWNQAAVAAKACLQAGDIGRAQKLIQNALRFSPNDREIQFVARVLERRVADLK